MSGVTLEKKPYLCSCKSSDLAGAMTHLRKVEDQELLEILAPYQDSQTTVVLKSPEIDSVIEYLSATRDVEQVFIDHNVIKAFTEDSIITYLAMKRQEHYELYRSQSETIYMW